MSTPIPLTTHTHVSLSSARLAKLMDSEDVALWLTPGEAWAVGFALTEQSKESYVDTKSNGIRPVTTITVPNSIPHNPPK